MSFPDYNPDWEPRGDKKSLMFGVELELEVEDGSVACVADKATSTFPDRFLIAKEDGSLTNGFELVSHPATLAYHRTSQWDKMLRATRAVPRNTCGMHVHIDRSGLTHMQVAKMFHFVNCHENDRFVYCVARRDDDYNTKGTAFSVSDVKRSRGRYVPLNLNNTDTVEMRIFAATIDINEFLISLEFCEALVAFCAPAVRSYHSGNSVAFCEFAMKRKRDWPLLAKFCAMFLEDDRKCEPTELEPVECGETCYNCDCRIDENECQSVYGYNYCDDCYSERFTYDEVSDCDIDSNDAVCTITDVTTHRDNCSRLSMSFYNRGAWELSDNTCDDYDGETIACEHVRTLHDGEVSHKDDSSIVKLSCGDYAKEDDCTEVDGDWYLTEDCVELANGDWHLTEDCVELANGEWAHVDDCECFHIVDDYGTAVMVWMLVDVADVLQLA